MAQLELTDVVVPVPPPDATLLAHWPTCRLAKIEANMLTMDKMVEDHRAAKRKARKEAREAKQHFQFPV
jgi:hypothetical protein